nr:MAG TPA: hypothetical protein [Caudoviricetes sp.]
MPPSPGRHRFRRSPITNTADVPAGGVPGAG